MSNIKLTPPHIIEATYRIVTPMFIGDAEQKASGISPASVKGALRFWWRALNWGRCLTDSNQNETKALRLLHEREAKLFGIAMDEQRASFNKNKTLQEQKANGQGKFTLRIAQPLEPNKTTVKSLSGNGLIYFLGIGLSREKERTALAGNQEFTLQLLTRNATDKDRQSLQEVLLVFGLLGGLGSRARKGWGSVAIQSLRNGQEDCLIPNGAIELEEFISHLIQKEFVRGYPPISAFSTHSRVDISSSTQTEKALDLLEHTGIEQQMYRSYGRNGKVNGKESEKNFAPDHDLVAEIIRTYQNTQPTTIPKRAVFGLPHNYYFSSTEKKADLAPSEQNLSRRASPLLIHTHEFPDGSKAIIQTFMPAMFLPEDTSLQYSMGKRDTEKVSLPFRSSMIDWRDITDYLDRFQNKVTVL